jgi:hypothetical protein
MERDTIVKKDEYACPPDLRKSLYWIVEIVHGLTE